MMLAAVVIPAPPRGMMHFGVIHSDRYQSGQWNAVVGRAIRCSERRQSVSMTPRDVPVGTNT